jgi:phage FluMu protein Com
MIMFYIEMQREMRIERKVLVVELCYLSIARPCCKEVNPYMAAKESTSITRVTPKVSIFFLIICPLYCPRLVQMISSGYGAGVMMAIR